MLQRALYCESAFEATFVKRRMSALAPVTYGLIRVQTVCAALIMVSSYLRSLDFLS